MTDPFNDAPAPEPANPADDFFSGGSPPCSFETIGQVHEGIISGMEKSQQKDMITGEKKTWEDGNPRELLIITLQTNERSAEIDGDDGERRLYVKKPSGMFQAIKTAMAKNRFQIGARLAIKYTKNGKVTKAGLNPPKEYVAKYTPAGQAEVPQQTTYRQNNALPHDPLPAAAPLSPSVDQNTAWAALVRAHNGDKTAATARWHHQVKAHGANYAAFTAFDVEHPPSVDSDLSIPDSSIPF